MNSQRDIWRRKRGAKDEFVIGCVKRGEMGKVFENERQRKRVKWISVCGGCGQKCKSSTGKKIM